MRGKRYIAVIALSWIAIILLGWYFIYDIPRMAQAEQSHKERLASYGAVLYAENCVTCHGPLGEGVVGPPLFVDAFRADPAENSEVYDLIYRTLDNGRPGTTTPHWVLLANGQWASYTAMPVWGADNGGPMNDQQLAALTHFIMMGDWNQVARHIPEPAPWRNPQTGEIYWDRMPDGIGISAEESRAGKEIFVNRACVSCHTLGQVGGNYGPDLTKVGAWGLTAEFLREWIDDPASVVERAPRYWSNYGGPYEFPVDVGLAADPGVAGRSGVQGGAMSAGEGDPIADRTDASGEALIGGSVGPDFPIPDTATLPPTVMPKMGLTDEELDTLVKYLMSLK